MTKQYDWAEKRSSEFEAIDPTRAIAILPTAAIEQHGPHLPVGTDTMIMQGMLDLFKANCPSDLEPCILPIQSIGKSNEHNWAAGTLSLSAVDIINTWTEIGLCVARTGFKKIVIVNSHGGNLDLISILARELRVQASLLAIKCQWGHFGYPESLFDKDELQYGLHGGGIETSLMLAFQPNSVDMKKAQHFRSSAENGGIEATGPISKGWIATDLNEAGVVGNALLATKDKGMATAEHQVNGFIELLRQVRDTPYPTT